MRTKLGALKTILESETISPWVRTKLRYLQN